MDNNEVASDNIDDDDDYDDDDDDDDDDEDDDDKCEAVGSRLWGLLKPAKQIHPSYTPGQTSSFMMIIIIIIIVICRKVYI